MSIKRDRIKLKTYFETGDRPTEEEFSDLVESGINQNDDEVFVVNQEVDPSKPAIPFVGLGTDDPQEKLHVDGSVEVNAHLQVKGDIIGKDDKTGMLTVMASKHGSLGGAYYHMIGSEFKVNNNGTPVDHKNQGGITFVAAGDGVLNGFSFVHYNHAYDPSLVQQIGNQKEWANSMRITGEGDIGIGTENPQARLHLASDNNADTGLKLTGQNGIQNGDILSTDGSGKVKWVPKTHVTNGLWVDDGNGNIKNGNNSNVDIDTSSDADAGVKIKTNTLLIKDLNNNTHTWLPYKDGQVYLTGNADGSGTGDIFLRSYSISGGYEPHMTVRGSGYVGIGTVTPDAKLEILGKEGDENSHGLLKITGKVAGKDLRLGVEGGAGKVPYTWIQSHGSVPLKINPHPAGNTTTINEGGGLVGIGTNDPKEKLHVNGNIQLQGNIYGKDSGSEFTINAVRNGEGAYMHMRSSELVGDNQGGITFVATKGADNTNGFVFAQRNTVPSGYEYPRCLSIDENRDSYFWNNKLYLRDDKDQNHGLGHFGDTNPNFANLNIDGPVLFGYRGGALGVRRGITEEVALRWNENGNVGVGVADPIRDLQVNGRTFIGNSLNVGPQKGNLLELNAEGRAGMAIITSANDVLNFHDSNTSNEKPFTIRAHGNRGVRFYSDIETMRITSDGKVGIGRGEINPDHLLHVGTKSTKIHHSYHYINGNEAAIVKNYGTANDQWVDISIHANGRLLAKEVNAFSDARIKSIKGLSNNENDLKTLSQIQITDYTHKDIIANGNKTIKKVIGQQLHEVFPQAVSLNKDVVPDIYQSAEQINGWIELKTNLKVGEKVRLILEESQVLFEVTEVEENRFKVAEEITDENVFVYGREVADFHVVDYDAIAMLNVSATQELAKRVESQQQEIDELKAMVKALMSKIPQ